MNGVIFCFFDNNYKEKEVDDTFINMSICQLNLKVSSSKELRQNVKTKDVVHDPSTAATITPMPQNTALSQYIYNLHITPYSEQKCLPHPTLISYESKGGDIL